MLLKTNNYKKAVFASAVAISAGFSIYFFQAFGSNPVTRIIWGAVAITVQAYQVICLREYHNTKYRKSPSKTPLVRYIFITIFSLLASVSFGTMDINKTIYLNSDKVAKIEIIDQRIEGHRQSLGSDNSDIIRQQIVDLQKETTQSSAYWQHIKNKQINELRRSLNNDKNDILLEIEDLKIKKAELIKLSATTKGAFEALGSILFIGEHAVRLLFLLCLSIIIELMVYSTSNFTVKIITAKKTVKNDQMTFDGMGAGK